MASDVVGDGLLMRFLDLLGKIQKAKDDLAILEKEMLALTSTHREELSAIKAILPDPAAATKRARKPRRDKGLPKARKRDGQGELAIRAQAPLDDAVVQP